MRTAAISLVIDKNREYQNGDENEDQHFYKEVYCIVDVDDNGPKPQGSGSLALAYSKIACANSSVPEIKHQLIVSNECFEIWYILHFQDITDALYRGTETQKGLGLINSSTKIETVLKSCVNWSSIPRIEKPKNRKIKSYIDFFHKVNSLGNENEAIQRAKTLISNSTNSNPSDNPSTEVHILIERLNSFKI